MGAHNLTITKYRHQGISPPTRGSREKPDHDLFTAAKESGIAYEMPKTYADIKVPGNNPMAVASGLTSGTLLGFGVTWQIWWLALLGAAGGIVTIAWYGVARIKERVLPAREIERATTKWLEAVETSTAVPRSREMAQANQGLAEHNA